MAITKRKDILDELVYRLGTIRFANGYETDIVTVTRHRDTDAEPFDSSEVPAINVRDGRAEINHTVSNDEHRLPVSIEIHSTSLVTTTEAENMLVDVLRCIDLNSTWGGSADGTTTESHDISISQAGDTITAATVEITINYTTAPGRI